jgi:hypothetical protein
VIVLVHSMRGLGDNIYQRAFIKQLRRKIWIDTPWPEIYRDIPNVHFVRPVTQLRTQLKNVNKITKWEKAPAGLPSLKIAYSSRGILRDMRKCFGIAHGDFDLPPLPAPVVSGNYVVIRPVTVREEWRADSRNPLPEYIEKAAIAMRKQGYTVVSVADLEQGKEWIVGKEPPADIRYHAGELSTEQLLALVAGAKAVIGGIGWIVPACVAAKVPALIICGGQGGYNAPELITSDTMDLSKMTFFVPKRFCRCTLKQHSCNKVIVDYDKKLTEWINGLPALV